jgi:hypothetical protein
MAHRLTVELDEREMSKVEAAVRSRRIDPKRMTAKQLVLALGAIDGAQVTPPAAGGHSVDAPTVDAIAGDASADAKRAKRLAAIMAMHGIWKDDPTKPQDGVEYQRAARAEWR